MMNLFKQAIENGELLKFALGKDEYFIADRDFGDHSVISAWLAYIEPLAHDEGTLITEKIQEMLLCIVNSKLDIQTLNECLLYNLHVYYYLDSEKKLKAGSLTEINHFLNQSLQEYITFLKNNNDPKENAVRKAVNLIKSRGGLSLIL